jgi:hypothetical protein
VTVAEEFTHLATTPEELESARQLTDSLRFREGGGFWRDSSGQLLFFPRWPWSRRAYVVPDEETGHRLRGVQRKLYSRNTIASLAFPFLMLIPAFFGLGERFAYAFAVWVVFLGTVQMILQSVLTSSMVHGLQQAPVSDEFAFSRRFERMARETSLVRLSLGACVVSVLIAACVGGLVSSGSKVFASPPGIRLLFQATCGLALVFFCAVLGLFAYEAWFLATRPTARRQQV